MTALFCIVAVVLMIVLVILAESRQDLIRRNKTQRATIIALGIELSEMTEENERLKARIGALENHHLNMQEDRERQAMIVLKNLERRRKIHERIERAKEVTK